VTNLSIEAARVQVPATQLHRQTGFLLDQVRGGAVVEVLDRWGRVQAVLSRPEGAR
jgi:hypothetical protein